jgi:hypothetical protein
MTTYQNQIKFKETSQSNFIKAENDDKALAETHRKLQDKVHQITQYQTQASNLKSQVMDIKT